MKKGCVIKGFPNGLRLLLDPEMPFDELLEDIQENIHNAADFLQDAKVAISFAGRVLTPCEEREILLCVEHNCRLQIACILDEDRARQAMYHLTLKEKLAQLSGSCGNFYRGTLLPGQYLESFQSIIILGDVMPGAKIRCVGNIIVLGTLAGSVCAGMNRDEEAFIAAGHFLPEHIRIGSVSKRRRKDTNRRTGETGFTIAAVSEGTVRIYSI